MRTIERTEWRAQCNFDKCTVHDKAPGLGLEWNIYLSIKWSLIERVLCFVSLCSCRACTELLNLWAGRSSAGSVSGAGMQNNKILFANVLKVTEKPTVRSFLFLAGFMVPLLLKWLLSIISWIWTGVCLICGQWAAMGNGSDRGMFKEINF